MIYKILVLVVMIFLHIVDDYYLQGILAQLKQKEWWEKNTPKPLYKYDYLVALFMHSFSWSFMIMFPILLYTIIFGNFNYDFYIIFIINIFAHMGIDNLKANEKKINLISDQSLHMWQIILTWFDLIL